MTVILNVVYIFTYTNLPKDTAIVRQYACQLTTDSSDHFVFIQTDFKACIGNLMNQMSKGLNKW